MQKEQVVAELVRTNRSGLKVQTCFQSLAALIVQTVCRGERVRLRNGGTYALKVLGLRIQKVSWKVGYVTRYIFSSEKLAYIVGERIAIEVEKVIFLRSRQRCISNFKIQYDGKNAHPDLRKGGANTIQILNKYLLSQICFAHIDNLHRLAVVSGTCNESEVLVSATYTIQPLSMLLCYYSGTLPGIAFIIPCP